MIKNGWTEEFYAKRFERRFWKQIKKTDTCWIWKGPKNSCGYGTMARRGYGIVRAHRVSWEFHFGIPPKNMCVCHKCDNPPCVRPEHLWLGTREENMMDAHKKGRLRKGEESGTSKLKNFQIEEIRKLRKEGFTQSEIGEKMGVKGSTIAHILQGHTWKHI
jgi:HNH endonuclease/Helix-turn-helix domain